MPTIHSFTDNGTACYANIRMDNGDPIFIGVAQTGVLVKKSRFGLLGAKLFAPSKVYESAMTAKALHYLYDDDRTPDGISNVVLRSFVNAALHAESTENLTVILNTAISEVEKQFGCTIDAI